MHSPILLAASVTLISHSAPRWSRQRSTYTCGHALPSGIHLEIRRPDRWQCIYRLTALHVGAQVGQSSLICSPTLFSYRQPAFQGVFVALTLLGDPILLLPVIWHISWPCWPTRAIDAPPSFTYSGTPASRCNESAESLVCTAAPPRPFIHPALPILPGTRQAPLCLWSCCDHPLLHPYTRQINRLGVALAGFLIP